MPDPTQSVNLQSTPSTVNTAVRPPTIEPSQSDNPQTFYGFGYTPMTADPSRAQRTEALCKKYPFRSECTFGPCGTEKSPSPSKSGHDAHDRLHKECLEAFRRKLMTRCEEVRLQPPYNRIQSRAEFLSDCDVIAQQLNGRPLSRTEVHVKCSSLANWTPVATVAVHSLGHPLLDSISHPLETLRGLPPK